MTSFEIPNMKQTYTYRQENKQSLKKNCLKEFLTAGTGRISDGGLNGEVDHVDDCAREEF